jgi:hypothetical protein
MVFLKKVILEKERLDIKNAIRKQYRLKLTYICLKKYQEAFKLRIKNI